MQLNGSAARAQHFTRAHLWPYLAVDGRILRRFGRVGRVVGGDLDHAVCHFPAGPVARRIDTVLESSVTCHYRQGSDGKQLTVK